MNLQFAGYEFDSALALIWAEKLAIIAGILIITWILAKAAKWSFAKLVDRVPLFQRAAGTGESIGMSLGKIVSLIIWLFGLLAILQRLQFDAVIRPLQSLLDNVMGYLPNFIGAAVIFFLGITVAKIVKDLIETTASTINFNKWANFGGVEAVTGNGGISRTLGSVAFILIVIPVAIGAIDVLKIPAITDPAKSMLSMVLEALPLIIGASLILGLGVIVSRWVGSIVRSLLPDMGADRAIAELGVLPSDRNASDVIATIVSLAIMIFFAIAAVNMLGFPMISDLLSTVLEQGSNLAFGGALIALGFIVARIIGNLIAAAAGDGLAPRVVYWLSIGLFTFIGIKQMSIGGPIIDYAFAGIVIAVSVAFALAFGLGGRDAAARILADMHASKNAAKSAAKPAAKKPAAK
jgi:hypothetical protein